MKAVPRSEFTGFILIKDCCLGDRAEMWVFDLVKVEMLPAFFLGAF